MKQEDVLDHGFVRYLEKFGDELTVINAARVSFGVSHTAFDEKDLKLLKYLIRNKHFSPFRHVFVRFHIKAPEFIMRQWYKHVVGIETTSTHSSQLHGWNEISGRYTTYTDFYCPKRWRSQNTDNKQGSGEDLDASVQPICENIFTNAMKELLNAYDALLDLNVAKEQARIFLPMNLYTEVIWTASVQAIMNFLELRLDPHAQCEIRVYAEAIDKMMKEQFPVLHDVWNKEK